MSAVPPERTVPREPGGRAAAPMRATAARIARVVRGVEPGPASAAGRWPPASPSAGATSERRPCPRAGSALGSRPSEPTNTRRGCAGSALGTWGSRVVCDRGGKTRRGIPAPRRAPRRQGSSNERRIGRVSRPRGTHGDRPTPIRATHADRDAASSRRPRGTRPADRDKRSGEGRIGARFRGRSRGVERTGEARGEPVSPQVSGPGAGAELRGSPCPPAAAGGLAARA